MDKSDSNRFDRIWKRKLRDENYAAYRPGGNLRVDKTLSTLDAGRRVLDIGCGTGILLSQLKPRFEEVYGIDISPAAVAVVRQNGIHASVLDLNFAPLPYEDGFFDAVTVLSTLQYFIDLDGTLGECNRVMSAGGRLFLSLPNMRAFWRIGKLLFQGVFPKVSMDSEGYDGGTLHYFAFSDIKELLGKNGFSITQSCGIFCLPKFVSRVSDLGFSGWVKREFFSAEVFVVAIKS